GIMSCKESAYERAAQSACSSQALRRSRGAGSGRRSATDGWPGRGASTRTRLGSGVHRRADPAPPLPANDPPPAAIRAGLRRRRGNRSLDDGVRGVQLGDRVADMTVVGSNTAYRALRADRVALVPAGLDAAEAATLILSWTTAYQLLHRAA